ncbi:MAG TPA: hypothetical protein VGH19_01345 [Verrucomicrobiae bacterium]
MPNEHDPKPTLWNIAGIRPLWLGIFLIVAAVTAVGVYLGKAKYQQKQLSSLLAQAKAAEAKGDHRSALVSLRRALQLAPDHIEATRMMALQADRHNSPVTPVWMQKLVELEPANPTNLVMWARSAMRQGDMLTADQVLRRFPKEHKETLSYHRLAGAFAVQARQYQAAEYHFAKAAKMNPEDPREQLNLSTIRLLSSRPEIVRESLATLEKLTSHPELGKEAAQALLADELRHKNAPKQLELARKIISMPDARFADRLMYLELLLRNKDPQFSAELAAAKKKALENSTSKPELIAWLNARDMAQEAYEWTKTLPAKDLEMPALAMTAAETLVKLKSWDELLTQTRKGSWEELEFMRFAFLARAQRELNLWGTSRSSWRQATSSLGLDTQSRTLLAKMAQGWGWYSEAEEIWLALSRYDTTRIPALKSLHKIYLATGNTRSLLKITETIAQLVPDDPVIKNNYAMLSLLLGQNIPKAKELARLNHEKFPKDAAATSTYAMALREDGKLKEAVALMETLPTETRKMPAIAGYWGVLLVEAGRGKEALPYLEAGIQEENLVPEERELMKSALAKIK